LLLLLVVALIAGACTGAEDATAPAMSDPGSTLVGGDGSGLVSPDPDPTPIEPSSEVRIGTLDNGLTYYARSNQSPGLGLSLHLVVDAGSLQQDEPESGLAHFVEHMLFNGTEAFPGNELNRALQSIGVEIGPDLNAYTSYDETVYSLELTAIDDDIVDLGFSVLREWAGNATIDQEATVAERGVVREEVRLRDEGADGAIAVAFDDAYLRGTAYERREPGGTSEAVLATDADDIRRFYDRWYRPDLMAVVAVGDLPIDRLEDEVIRRFSDLTTRGSDAPPRDEPAVEPIGEPVTRVVTHPEARSRFGSVDYSITTWDPGTVGGERLSLIQDLYALMIQNRLLDAADRAEVELDDPWVGRFMQNRNQTLLGFNFDGPDLGGATEHVLTEMRHIELTGFDDDELTRAVTQFQGGLDQFLAAAPSTSDFQYAQQYVAHFLTGSQISSVEDTHNRLGDALADITAGEVTNLFRWEMAQAAPIVIVVGPDADDLPDEARLAEAVADAGAIETVTDGGGEVAVIEELMERPEPVAPASQRRLDELGGHEWAYDNGVTVRFIDSTIGANSVDVLAVGQGGWSTLDPADGVLSYVATEAVSRSGAGPHDRLAYRRFLADATTLLVPYIDETTEGFVGNTGTEDLELLLQQLHLAVTAPKVDATALRQAIDGLEDQERFVETDTWTASQQALADVLYDGDQRFALAPPDASELTAERALGIYRQRLGAVDDLVVAIVGDVSRAEVEELADRYLGTLPSRSGDTWVDVRPPPVDRTLRRDLTVGSGEATGSVSVLFPSVVDLDVRTQVELKVIEQVLDARLFDELREDLGATYTGFVWAETRIAPTEGVDFLLFANVDPSRVEEVRNAMVVEAKDLVANGPRPEELQRAVSVLEADFGLVDNGQLLDMLLTDADREALTVDRRLELLAETTAARVQVLAARVLPLDIRIEVVALPTA
jgi:zinc protease